MRCIRVSIMIGARIILTQLNTSIFHDGMRAGIKV
jgi:hypothetical protein